MDTVLKLNNISKNYNVYSSNIERIKSVLLGRDASETKHALKNVSFEVKKGERIILFGVADSGRSTLMRIIAGITTPSKGTVYRNFSQNVMMDSKAGIENEFTCRENVFLKANVAGIRKEEIAPQVDAILEESGCADFAELPMKRAAKGTHARLSMAVHLKKDAELLLADEVFNGGGNYVMTKCEDRIAEYLEENENTTAIITSNRIPFAKKAGTRAIVLDKGKIVFDGDVAEAGELFKTINNKK